MVSAMLFAVPSAFAIAVFSFSMSAGAAFIRARKPDMAFLPTRASAFAVCSDSVIRANPYRRSARMSENSRILPSAFVVLSVIVPSFSPETTSSPFNFVMMVRREVPAWDALIPELAIKPMASAVSSTLYPIAPAIGAAYLKVSPIMLTLVLAFEDAAASTSAKCPESSALRPKAVRASVTISEVVPKSSPDAAARFMMPSRPDVICSVFHPAMAMYSRAWADSEAENLVVSPISFAFARSLSRSSPVAPEIAATFDISASKSAAVLTAAMPKPTMGAVTFVVISLPTPEIFPPISSIFPPTTCKLFGIASRVDFIFSRSAVALLTACCHFCVCVEFPPVAAFAFSSASFDCSRAFFCASICFVRASRAALFCLRVAPFFP